MKMLGGVPGLRLPPGFARIYFHHVRRVGGTSLNQTFFQLVSRHPELASANIRRSKKKVIRLGGTRFVGANRQELEGGNYFYGFSHIPSHVIRLPPETFTIALFRDPVARVISHYRMILDYERRHVQRYWMSLERQWLGNCFGDFCRNLPRERLYAQLFMFSASFRITEAVESARRCNFAFRTENYAVGLANLSDALGIALAPRRAHRNTLSITIDASELETLRNLMSPEYEFLDRLREKGYA